jgi:hypothetical protein
VSRLFPERLQIRLSPTEISLGDRKIPCDASLQALQALELRRASVSVILSNAFVRYALVPWSDALSGQAEEAVYVRHHFLRVHGERAKGWTFRASPAPARAPRLCSAIDTSLLEQIKACFKRQRALLTSIQPALMAVFNRCRGEIPAGGAWLALVEPDRACIGLHAKGNWQAVSNGKMSARGEWLPLLELERHRLAGEAPDLVLLHSDETVPAEAPGWKVERLAA